MIRLSICIPTYNFGAFIGQTLDSILPQLTPEVEVIVFDGGSQDQTADEVQKRQVISDRLTYFRQDHRGGIDRDIESSVAMAHGEYCWLFSADDVMRPGAIASVLDALETGMDIYLCEHILCDFHLQPIRPYPPFRGFDGPRTFDFSDEEQRRAYFGLAKTSEAFFSFMSGPIFKVARWRLVDPPDSFRGTCWIVAGHLLFGMNHGMRLHYLSRPLLLKRDGNDSFSDRGVINRYRIAIEGFQHVADTVFGRYTFEAKQIRRVLRSDVNLKAMLFAKLLAVERPDEEDIQVLDALAAAHYSDPDIGTWVKRCTYSVATARLLRLARSIKRSLKRLKGGSRAPA